MDSSYLKHDSKLQINDSGRSQPRCKSGTLTKRISSLCRIFTFYFPFQTSMEQLCIIHYIQYWAALKCYTISKTVAVLDSQKKLQMVFSSFNRRKTNKTKLLYLPWICDKGHYLDEISNLTYLYD